MTASPAYRRTRVRSGALPVSSKFYQGLGALPETVMNFAFNTFLLFHYNQVLGMSASLASLGISLALIVDAFVDPAVGSYSDNLRHRLGRRHPLMYAAAVPLGVALWAAFTPPEGASEHLLFAWLTLTVIATRVAMTFFLIPWNALYAELSDDYAERSSIITWRFLVGWIGGVTVTFATWTFLFPSTPEYTPGHLNPAGYHILAPLLGGLVTIAVLLTTQLTRREIPYLLQPHGATPAFSLGLAARELVLAVRNRAFRMLFLGILTSSAVGGTLGALDIYMNTYFWGLRPEELRWFTVAILGSFMAFLLVAPTQARFEKRDILLACFAFAVVDGIVVVCCRLWDLLPGNGDPMLLYILVGNSVLATLAVTLLFIMFSSMVADALDAQELETGKRQEGVFSAALAFSGKATSGLGVIIGGLVLDYVLVFPRGVAPDAVAADLVTRVGVVNGIVVPLCYLLPFWLVTRYRLGRAEHARIIGELLQRRAAVPPDDRD